MHCSAPQELICHNLLQLWERLMQPQCIFLGVWIDAQAQQGNPILSAVVLCRRGAWLIQRLQRLQLSLLATSQQASLDLKR